MLRTDASGVDVAAVLLQENDGKLYPVGYKDHKPLRYLKDAAYQNDRVFRCEVAVQEYSFRVENIPGKDNLGADLMSRTGYSC